MTKSTLFCSLCRQLKFKKPFYNNFSEVSGSARAGRVPLEEVVQGLSNWQRRNEEEVGRPRGLEGFG